MPDAFLDAADIRGSTFIRYVEIHDTLGSTNHRAAELARKADIELPALVAARHQTAGRGRGQNTWQSAEGALTFSVLLDPTVFGISTQNWPQLSLATAVALCDSILLELNSQSPQVLAIKWPNDIMLGGAKLCGILIESPGAASAKDRLIIGIGINANNSWKSAPPTASVLASHQKLPPNATSLYDTTNRMHNLQQLLCHSLRALETRISQHAAHNPQLPIAWERLCWLTDRRVEIQSHGNSIEGICRGIAPDGTLIVENDAGTQHIRSGSVSVI